MRHLTIPKSLAALIGLNLRVIVADVWAKLVWASRNLAPYYLPRRGRAHGGNFRPNNYPIELCRALATTWLFAGLRNNEILRLRVGCIRWLREQVIVPGTGDMPAADAVCLLDVPVNKTATAFTKPVDRIVEDAIAALEKVRPQGAKRADWKTGVFGLSLHGPAHRRWQVLSETTPSYPRYTPRPGVPLADVGARTDQDLGSGGLTYIADLKIVCGGGKDGLLYCPHTDKMGGTMPADFKNAHSTVRNWSEVCRFGAQWIRGAESTPAHRILRN